MKDLYDSQTYGLKTRVDIWTRMDAVPVEYGTFTQTFHLTMWLFQFVTGINFKWDYVLWRIIAMLFWIGLWTKLRIYKVPPHPVIWYCRGFGSLCRALMLFWMLWSKNKLKVSHRKQVNAPSNMKLATSLMNFECQTCEIFEGFSYHQEDEAIAPTIFATTVGLGDIINKLVLSNFMVMARSFSFIFDTGDTY